MEVEKENQNGNEMEDAPHFNETEKEPKVEITEQKDETKDLVGHGGQGKYLEPLRLKFRNGPKTFKY